MSREEAEELKSIEAQRSSPKNMVMHLNRFENLMNQRNDTLNSPVEEEVGFPPLRMPAYTEP